MHGLEHLRSLLRVAGSFIHSRWWLRFSDRRRLEAWQARQLRRFLRETAPQAPRLRAFRGLPLERWPQDERFSALCERLHALRRPCAPRAAATGVAAGTGAGRSGASTLMVTG